MAATSITHMMTEAAQPRPSVTALRSARQALNAAITAGANHLTELRDLVEDELIDQLTRTRRTADR